MKPKMIGRENVKASYIRSPNLMIEQNINIGIKTKYVMMRNLLSIIHPVLPCISLRKLLRMYRSTMYNERRGGNRNRIIIFDNIVFQIFINISDTK